MEQHFDSSRVLIAAVDATLRHQIYKRLLDQHIFSDTATDAGYALEHLASRAYGVVLLDLSLSAAERVVETIGRLPAGQRPVVLVLANSSEARSLDVDVVQVVLRKPVNLRHLAEIVGSCIRVADDAQPPAEPKSSSREESAA